VREAASCDLKDLVAKFIPEAIGKDIEKACQGIYPLQARPPALLAPQLTHAAHALHHEQ
jgi:hypothetical protein